MTGPRIIEQAPAPIKRAATEGQSGIRRAPSSSNAWVAIDRGVYVDTFYGLGAQSKAIRAAGSSRILP